MNGMILRLYPASDGWCCVLACVVSIAAAGVLYVALFHDRSRGRLRCPACWYELNADADRCPECGALVRSFKNLRRTRRRWSLAMLGGCLLVYAASAVWIPDARVYGWAHRLPTPVLVRLYPWADLPAGRRRIDSIHRPVLTELLLRGYAGIDDAAAKVLVSRALAELDTSTDTLRRRDAMLLLFHAGRAHLSADAARHIAESEPDPEWQTFAWALAVRVAPSDPAIQRAVIERLRARPDNSNVSIIKALPEGGEGLDAFIPVYVELMEIGVEAAPAEAMWKLMLIGPAAHAALQAIERISADRPSRMLAGAAACIRGEMRTDADVFVSWLSNDDPQARYEGANILCVHEVAARGAHLTDQIIDALLNPRPDDHPGMEDRLREAVRLHGVRRSGRSRISSRLLANPE